MALALSSAVGAAGYGLLIRWFWVDLSFRAIAAISVVCLLASVAVFSVGAPVRTQGGLWFAVSWWLVFSTGLGVWDARR